MAHVLSPRVAQKDFLPLISFLSIILGSYFDFRALGFLHCTVSRRYISI